MLMLKSITMKRTIYIFLLLTLAYSTSYSQGAKVTEIKDKNLKSVLCSIDTVIFKSNYVLAVTLYKVSNPSGSAHQPETDEVSNRYLIAVSSIDEVPDQYLFNVGDFYNPKILKFEQLKNGNYRVTFEHGVFKARRRMYLNISLKMVTLTSS